MTVRTKRPTRRNLASLLEQAARRGEARVTNRQGQIFVIRPERKRISPLDVEGVNLSLTTAEIVPFVHEGRRFSTDKG